MESALQTAEITGAGLYFLLIKNFYEKKPGKKTTNVSGICYAIVFSTKHTKAANNLKKDPKPKRNKRRHAYNGKHNKHIYFL